MLGQVHLRKDLLIRLVKVRPGLLILALAATFALQSILTTDQAYACSCAGFPTPLEELESSDAVFVGEAVENGLKDPDPRDDATFGGIRFDVSESWKGVPGDSVVLYGQSGSYYGPPEEGEMIVESSCAVPFARGKTYLVYASRVEDGNFLQANACGRTGALASVGADLEALGPATDHLPGTGGSDLRLLGVILVGTFVFLPLVATLAGALPARQPGRDKSS